MCVCVCVCVCVRVCVCVCVCDCVCVNLPSTWEQRVTPFSFLQQTNKQRASALPGGHWPTKTPPGRGENVPAVGNVCNTLIRQLYIYARLQQSDTTTCLKPLPVLLLLFAESISVIQHGSVNDSRAAAFRHGAVVARNGSLVMNQYVQLPVQTIQSPDQL